MSRQRTPGTLIYVMGPSGSGKDSLMDYARRSLNSFYSLTWNTSSVAHKDLRPVFFVRRYITRPAGAGGERHYPLSMEEFQLRRLRGEFAMSWESHGLGYGVGAVIDVMLSNGAVVVVNGSRKYLPRALKKYPSLTPVLISAHPEVLCSRLEKRGRENTADIRERLAGANMEAPDIPGLIQIDNSGSLEDTGRCFTELFYGWRQRFYINFTSRTQDRNSYPPFCAC